MLCYARIGVTCVKHFCIVVSPVLLLKMLLKHLNSTGSYRTDIRHRFNLHPSVIWLVD